MRAPGMLYQERGTDSVSNLYNIKVANKTIDNIPLELKLEGINGKIEIIGSHNRIQVKNDGEGTGSFFVILPNQVVANRKTELKIGLYDKNKRIDILKTNFLGPVYDPDDEENKK